VRFDELALAGVFSVELEPVHDERGFFARTYAREEFAAHDVELDVVHASISFNERRGTLRGMHLQTPPHDEAKLVRCVTGKVHDVVADLRAGSPTQFRWVAVELSAERRNALFVPPGCAHGFLTLVNGCELEYLISAAYAASAAVGVRWDDSALAIEWPFEPAVISERDAAFADLDAERVAAQGPGGLT